MKTIRSRLLNHCIYQRAKARGEKQSYPEGEHKRDCDICQAADELSRLSSEVSAHKQTLKDLFWLIDESWLVRDISNDGDPLWALKQVGYVRRLAKAKAVLDSVSLERDQL